MEKDDAMGRAGLSQEALPEFQRNLSSQLKSITGCLYAKTAVEHFGALGGQVVCVGRALGGIPFGYYTAVAFDYVHPAAAQSICHEMSLR